jgi:hypothetical protein
MKNNIILYGAIALLLIGVVYMYFQKEKPAAPAVDPVKPQVPTVGGACFDVPSTFPTFSSALVPGQAKEFLGFTGVQLDYNMEQRVLGFFSAIDVQPTDERMKYFGKDAILNYLQTPSGQLPHWDVVRGSLRCNTQKNFIKFI